MKYLRQFLLILLISFIGELLHEVLPLPVPASVYGFAILFIGLLSGVIKLAHVKDTGKLLIEIMPVMFIPAGVGLLESIQIQVDESNKNPLNSDPDSLPNMLLGRILPAVPEFL